jgi:hypothetical protein
MRDHVRCVTKGPTMRLPRCVDQGSDDASLRCRTKGPTMRVFPVFPTRFSPVFPIRFSDQGSSDSRLETPFFRPRFSDQGSSDSPRVVRLGPRVLRCVGSSDSGSSDSTMRDQGSYDACLTRRCVTKGPTMRPTMRDSTMRDQGSYDASDA